MTLADYEKAFNIDVECLFNTYNSNNNIWNKHKHKRPIKFDMCDSIKVGVKQSKFNAQACYKDNEDEIVVTTGLFQLMHKLFTTIAPPDKAACMLSIAACFCVAHEFAHLYSGHCQLCDTRMLNAVYDPNSGISSFDNHTVEYDADCTAASKVAEKMMGFTKRQPLLNIYRSEEAIIADCLKAIHGFFFILRCVDGSANQLYYSDTHPPSIARHIYSIQALRCHIKEMYRENIDIKLIEDLFVHNEELFSSALGMKLANDDYRIVMDNSLFEYKRQLEFNWSDNIKGRLKELTRMPLAFE